MIGRGVLFSLAALALWPGCATGGDAPCGPSQPCPQAEQQCVWLPDENRGFCAPACSGDGGCPEGLVCQQVAAGECWPCRLAAEACVEP